MMKLGISRSGHELNKLKSWVVGNGLRGNSFHGSREKGSLFVCDDQSDSQRDDVFQEFTEDGLSSHNDSDASFAWDDKVDEMLKCSRTTDKIEDAASFSSQSGDTRTESNHNMQSTFKESRVVPARTRSCETSAKHKQNKKSKVEDCDGRQNMAEKAVRKIGPKSLSFRGPKPTCSLISGLTSASFTSQKQNDSPVPSEAPNLHLYSSIPSSEKMNTTKLPVSEAKQPQRPVPGLENSFSSFELDQYTLIAALTSCEKGMEETNKDNHVSLNIEDKPKHHRRLERRSNLKKTHSHWQMSGNDDGVLSTGSGPEDSIPDTNGMQETNKDHQVELNLEDKPEHHKCLERRSKMKKTHSGPKMSGKDDGVSLLGSWLDDIPDNKKHNYHPRMSNNNPKGLFVSFPDGIDGNSKGSSGNVTLVMPLEGSACKPFLQLLIAKAA
ncbi:hypothetical protein ACA910_002033 [Epithemia clementina (nom. ined.)]